MEGCDELRLADRCEIKAKVNMLSLKRLAKSIRKMIRESWVGKVMHSRLPASFWKLQIVDICGEIESSKRGGKERASITRGNEDMKKWPK